MEYLYHLKAALLLAFSVFICSSLPRVQAQTQEIDFLVKHLHGQPEDTNKVRTLNNIAFAFYMTNPKKASEYAAFGLSLAEKLGDSVGIARSLNIIGLSLYVNGAFGEAVKFYERSLAIAKKINNAKRKAAALNNIGIVYMDIAQYDKAIPFLLESLAADDEAHDEQGKSTGFSNLGHVYNFKKMPEKALQYLSEAMILSQKFADSSNMTSVLVNQSESYHQLGRLDSALILAQKALALAKQHHFKQYIRDSYEVLARIYSTKKDFEQAYSLKIFAAEAQDSLRSSEQFERISRLQAEYESLSKDRQIEGLVKDQELQTKTRQTLILLGVVLLGGFAALYSRYRYKVRSERKLQKQNDEILRQQELLGQQAADIELANTTLNEKNLALEYQQNILEEQARDIEVANAALQEKNLQLEHLNSEKNEFLGIAAHDLKNPLAHIIMVVGTTTRYYDRMNDDDILKQMQAVGKAAERMTEIITNLLDVNAIERGGLQLHCTHYDISPDVQSVVELYSERAKEKDIRVHFQSSTHANVHADKQAMMQVLDNVISNAVKYSPRGKNVVVRIQSRNEAVRIEVQDEGEGISEEDMKKLFGKFARLSARPTGGEHSTGLGLSIVKKMVEAMNGKVWCESELGKGATFIVELPTAPSRIPQQ
ncbi:MAG: hypothetical protein EAZ92_11000 [Candidatus Kapaibacterium sp.]|nr:MAG: hypothetical protein EAZ92_11000 [Candidatus Kapabacteria bacterium]